MMRPRVIAIAVVVALVASAVAAVLSLTSSRRATRPPAKTATAAPAQAPPAPGRKIKARLYYVSADGTELMPVDREVSYADGALGQAQEIVNAQLSAAAPPLVSAIPPGTKLRTMYLTGNEAYVDLSRDISSAHTGGSQDELLTIYSIVNALTVNLPAITAVQLLVDGKEVDTLAGHIDLRQPLGRNLDIVGQ